MTALFFPAALCAAAYLFFVTKPASAVRSSIKTASVALLAAGALGSGMPHLAIALGLCAIGDLALSRDGDGAFKLGAAFFAAGHVAYATHFLNHPASDLGHLFVWPGWAVSFGLLLFGVVFARRLSTAAGALRPAVLAYVPIIIGMGIAAITLPSEGRMAFVLPSAVLFIISDVVLAAERFLLREESLLIRAAPFVVWPLCWCAQAGFLVSFSG